MKVGVLLGGISAEKDVSLESGRNVFEKINSYGKHTPIPIFVTGTYSEIKLYIIPINLLFKDNADLIAESIKNYKRSLVEKDKDLENFLKKYVSKDVCKTVTEISFDLLPKIIDFAFLALHGRPGEDGTIQRILDNLKLPYNGSSADIAELTIDKFLTNRLLAKHGVKVANQFVINSDDWIENKYKILQHVSSDFTYPCIVKPVDDGSSTGVAIIDNEGNLEEYLDIAFMLKNVNDKYKDIKITYHKQLLIEDLITKGNATRILEITGGFLTHKEEDTIVYEMFSPSESIANNKILSLEEKFLSGEGQNITPARYSSDSIENTYIENVVKQELERVSKILNLRGYARIDAFVKVYEDKIETWIIEVNSLPALTPATCLFHQCILNGYAPAEFIQKIIEFSTAL